jgi:membrane protein implicated in regulation of membrane protease activity
MSPSRLARLAFALLMLLGLVAVPGLGMLVFGAGFDDGRASAWLVAWMLLFVVVLPTALLAMSIVRMLRVAPTRQATVPYPGQKIPGAGQ